MKRTAVISAAAVLVISAGCSKKSDDSSSSSSRSEKKGASLYSLTVTETGVELKNSDGSLFQAIDTGSDWLYGTIGETGGDFSGEGYLCPYDFDFDGYDDLAVPVYISEGGSTYAYYRFDPEEGKLVDWDELNSMYTLGIPDSAAKTLTFSDKFGLSGSYSSVYKWGDKGYLVPISATIQYVAEDGETYKDYIEYDENGETKTTKTEKVSE